MNELTITQRRQHDVTILDLAGNLRMGEDIIRLRQELRVLTAEAKTKILLNMAEISQVDSSGLGELVAGFLSLQKSGGVLKLLNLTRRVSELMMMTKLLTVFDTFENEEDALNSFQVQANSVEAVV